MTIFDYLKDIVVSKTGSLTTEQYVPYLVARWLSFINPTVALAINQTNIATLLESKEMHYKIMLSLFPKSKYLSRIHYIKKIKENEQKEDKRIEMLAKNYELSKREIQKMLNVD